MEKQILFFSHSNKDASALKFLKETFEKKTSNTVIVFLSSDGQSIPFGRNWSNTIQEALNKTSIMITFLSPNSIGSKWVYFESGYAYSKGIQVTPVGINGIDLGLITSPLGLLQGFNITNKDGLNNLLSLTNQKYKTSFDDLFSEDDYVEFQSLAQNSDVDMFGGYSSAIESIRLKLKAPPTNAFFENVISILKSSEITYQIANQQITIQGISIDFPSHTNPDSLTICIDPLMLSQSSKLIDKILLSYFESKDYAVTFDMHFNPNVAALSMPYKISSRLCNSGATLDSEYGCYRYNDFLFSISNPIFRMVNSSPSLLSVSYKDREFPAQQVGSLIQILFSKGILYLTEESRLDYFNPFESYTQ